MLKLVKPDLIYYEQYNEMMKEWREDGSRIAPWFLDKPCESLDSFYELIRNLDDIEKGMVDKQFSSSSSYFVIDENDKLIGATRLAHYLTIDGLNTWGHIGYGVRPSERRKGYATEMLKLTLEEGRNRYHINEFLLGAYETNIASVKTIEKCNGNFYRTVVDQSCDGRNKIIKQYWVK